MSIQPKLCFVLECDNLNEMHGAEEKVQFQKFLNNIIKSEKAKNYELSFIIIYDAENEGIKDKISFFNELIESYKNHFSFKILAAHDTAYYEKKSLAAYFSDAEYLAYIDSDCAYKDSWFDNAIEPFETQNADVSAGITYGLKGRFLENVSLLSWFWGIEGAKNDPYNKKGSFKANNFMVKAELMKNLPFSGGCNARIWGGYWIENLKRHNCRIIFTDATAYHKQLSNLSYFVRRSFKQGVDEDKYITLFKPHKTKFYRIRKALHHLFKVQKKFIIRYIKFYKEADINNLQFVPGLLVGIIYKLIQSVGQIYGVFFNTKATYQNRYEEKIKTTEVFDF